MVNEMMEVCMGYLESGEEKPLIYPGWVSKYFLELAVPELKFKEVEASQGKWRFLGVGPWRAGLEFLVKEKKNAP